MKNESFIIFLINTGVDVFKTIWAERKTRKQAKKARKEAASKDNPPANDTI